MQDYVTNNFHGISGMRTTSYILPGRMCGGRTREKSLRFRGLCIKHLHAHFFHVKNPNKKNFSPQSLLRSEINNPLCAKGHALPCNGTAQSAHARPTPPARSYNWETISANFGPEPPKAIANAMQSHKLIPIMGKGLLCVSGDLILL